jgi:hypothetical protein
VSSQVRVEHENDFWLACVKSLEFSVEPFASEAEAKAVSGPNRFEIFIIDLIN